MELSSPVDGFQLAYDRVGAGPGVVLLHGWPGDRGDYVQVVPLLSTAADVVVPDLRGFGSSDKDFADPAKQYSADAQARSVIGLIEESGIGPVVLGGYDIGSRTAQAVARDRPDLVRALVISPPVPGAGTRVLGAAAQREFWYQQFHQLPLADLLLDGKPRAVRAYLQHFWSHWSGPSYTPPAAHLDRLAAGYGEPQAFTASINWYRAGSGGVARALAEQVPAAQDRLAVPTTVLWPEFDPLFPREWSDRLPDFFADARLEHVDGIGHFLPVEAPHILAAAITTALSG
jgi:pimeloyl-ACP methyl ester carboxylesterase